MIQRDSIPVPTNQLSAFCRKHHIQKLSLFGSVLHDDCRSESDIDILVEFEPGQTPGLAFFAMQNELTELFGRKVDLNTSQDLSPYFRDQVLQQCKVIYDTAG